MRRVNETKDRLGEEHANRDDQGNSGQRGKCDAPCRQVFKQGRVMLGSFGEAGDRTIRVHRGRGRKTKQWNERQERHNGDVLGQHLCGLVSERFCRGDEVVDRHHTARHAAVEPAQVAVAGENQMLGAKAARVATDC